jgi:hypothetical protein
VTYHLPALDIAHRRATLRQPQGTSALVSGFYFDDSITNTSFGDPWPHMAEDMGITPPVQARTHNHHGTHARTTAHACTHIGTQARARARAQAQLAKDYTANMARVYDEVLQRGKYCGEHWPHNQTNQRRFDRSAWPRATKHCRVSARPTRHGATWHGATWHGATWHGATWHGATWQRAETAHIVRF